MPLVFRAIVCSCGSTLNFLLNLQLNELHKVRVGVVLIVIYGCM